VTYLFTFYAFVCVFIYVRLHSLIHLVMCCRHNSGGALRRTSQTTSQSDGVHEPTVDLPWEDIR